MDEQAKHESDIVLAHLRIARSSSFRIVGDILSGFGVSIPAMQKWWPLPDDEKIKKQQESKEPILTLSGSEFMNTWRKAFRGD